MEDNNLYGMAYGLDERGRHKTAASAFEAAFKDLSVVKNEFFDSLCDNWKRLFPSIPARPGRYEAGRIFIYVRNSAASYVVRPKLREIAAVLSRLPGAPKRLELRLEQHVL